MFGSKQNPADARWGKYNCDYYNKNKDYLTRAVNDISDCRSSSTAEFYCVYDGHIFSQIVSNHVKSEKNGKCGCAECRVRAYTNVCRINTVPDIVKSHIVGDIPEDGYSSRDIVTLRCDKCGKIFTRKCQDLWYKSTGELKFKRLDDEIWCTDCASKTSSSAIEDLLLSDIQKVYPDAKKETYHFKKLIGRGCYEGDIVVPSKRAVVECDGEWWHMEGDESLGYKPRGYHHNKDEVIHAYGYRVYHVMSEELEEYYNGNLREILEWIESGVKDVRSPFDTYDNIEV